MITVQCKHCSESHRFKDSAAGKSGKCPNCNSRIRIPGRRRKKADRKRANSKRKALREQQDDGQNHFAIILGIPQQITAPNHYELLGLSGITDDIQLIKNASLAQNAKLQRWQNSEIYATNVKPIEIQLAEARSVLLNPELKRQYDSELLAKSGGSLWFFRQNDKDIGPIKENSLRRLHALFLLPSNTLIRKKDEKHWLLVSDAFDDLANENEPLPFELNQRGDSWYFITDDGDISGPKPANKILEMLIDMKISGDTPASQNLADWQSASDLMSFERNRKPREYSPGENDGYEDYEDEEYEDYEQAGGGFWQSFFGGALVGLVIVAIIVVAIIAHLELQRS